MRLTKRSNKTVHENGVCCTHFNGKECSERMGECTDNCPWEEAVWSKLADYEDIGTVSEFRELKEKRECKDCAGCTVWKCDCANERDNAINEFANFLHKKAKENNGLRLSSETRSWTHPSIFDYVNEFKEQHLDWCEEKE